MKITISWVAVFSITDVSCPFIHTSRSSYVYAQQMLLFSCSVIYNCFGTPWTVAPQAPPSMGFSRQEYWSGVPLPSPGDLPDPGIEPRSPTLQAYALTSEPKLKAALRLGSWPIWLSHASISTALAPEWVAWVPLRDPQENTQGKDRAWS